MGESQYSLEEIRAHWASQALTHGQSPAASWADEWAIQMEIREMLTRLDNDQRVLDIGCANGYSTLSYASQKRLDIRGLDVVPEMIEEAKRRLADSPTPFAGRVEFDVGDISELKEPSGAFDRVIVTRVVINLGDWQRQERALKECARVLRAGGLLLLSEATLQGWSHLNEFRGEWGLDPIPVPKFNLYLDEDAVVEALSGIAELVEIVQFASTYYVGTRVLKPLLAKALGCDVDVAAPGMHWNRWFSQLPPAGDYGTQKLFVFSKL
jgi:SAM-dependent methyltransferase